MTKTNLGATSSVFRNRRRSLWRRGLARLVEEVERRERLAVIAESALRAYAQLTNVVWNVESYIRYGDKFRGLLTVVRNFDLSLAYDQEFFVSSRNRLQEAKISDLEWCTGRGFWVVTGRDPRLVLKGPFPAGFLRVQLSAEVFRLPAAVSAEAEVEIFADFGAGFSSRYVFGYRVTTGKISIDEILALPRDALALRVDPINARCELRIAEFRVDPAPLEYVAWRMGQGFLARGGNLATFGAAFGGPAELRSAFRKMSSAIDRARDDYQSWVEATAIGPAQREKLAAQATRMPHRPKISVVTPTYRSDLTYLERAIDSVVAQVYPDWELCIVDDGSEDPRLLAFLEKQAQRDGRIKFRSSPVNGGVSAASNVALGLSSGVFVTFLDHDDELAPQALFRLASAIVAEPEADMIYSDEDKIDANGRRHDPLFKPDWSPETMLGCMYTCHLSAYRRSLVDEVGGLRSEFDLSQDYDLALRISRKARKIVHIPDVLYHWRTLPRSTASSADAKPTAEIAARRAVQDHLDALQMRGVALPGPFPGSHRIKLEVLGEPLVSIVIPTSANRIVPSEQRWRILDLVRSIYKTSTYRNFEIVLVENGDIEDPLKTQLEKFPISYARYDGINNNYSEKTNLGVVAAKGDFVILLNDDLGVITPEWIEELISWIQRPGVVAVGAKLFFENRKIQHAGVLMLGCGPSHVYYGARENYPGQFGGAVLLRNYSAVAAACIAVKKEDYVTVSGFDPAFGVNYNSVDFCLRLRQRGRIVYTPQARLFYFESASHDEYPPTEWQLFSEKWKSVIGFDPYYNCNLSQYTPYRVNVNLGNSHV